MLHHNPVRRGRQPRVLRGLLLLLLLLLVHHHHHLLLVHRKNHISLGVYLVQNSMAPWVMQDSIIALEYPTPTRDTNAHNSNWPTLCHRTSSSLQTKTSSCVNDVHTSAAHLENSMAWYWLEAVHVHS